MKPLRIVTLLGIRPDIIRMHKLIRLMDDGQKAHGYTHIFAHTGQHFDYELDQVFYRQLGVRKPDVNFHVGKTLRESGGPTDVVAQTGLLFQKTQEFIDRTKPNVIMFLGDTNSVLASMIAARNIVPVVHIEGGGRSYDWRMPEEKCRIIIDHMSDAIYSYLPRYKEILLSEGVPDFRVTVIGNIIDDAVRQYLPEAEKSDILESLGVRSKRFALLTLHREENISDSKVLTAKMQDIMRLSREMPLVFPLMPRVRKRLDEAGLLAAVERSGAIVTKPLGFFEFLKLENQANVVITDSGTVQEETLILGTPCLVTRRSTERPETLVAGASIMSDDNLYKNTHKAMRLPLTWDRTVLNPYKTSPSEVVFEDLMKKLQSDYFGTSRSFASIKRNRFVREAYGK